MLNPKRRCEAVEDTMPESPGCCSPDELGRRLLAAIMSYALAVESVDYTKKKYLPQDTEIDPSWTELGEILLRKMIEHMPSRPTQLSDAECLTSTKQ